MKTIILEEPGRFVLTETDPPATINPGEALVRVHRVGICGTDLHAYRGRQPFFTYPRILGHELGVEVLEVDANEYGVRAGDRCALEPYINCGRCIACRHSRSNCCATLQCMGVHCDGGMRELLVVPVNKLRKSATLSYDQLALVETLGIGAHAVNRAGLAEGEFCLVIGAGPIGLSVIQFAKIAKAKVIVLDVNTQRLAFAKEHLGVEHTIVAGPNTLDELRALTDGDLPSAVFDATGNKESVAGAFQYVAQGGRLVLVGLFQGDVTFSDPEFHRKEMTLLASRNSTGADFRRIIVLMESGAIDVAPWITHRATAVEMVERFPAWLEPESGVIKAMVEF